MTLNNLRVRAVKTEQAGTPVYAFFTTGRQLAGIADISRISQDTEKGITGFQRPEIRSHVREITTYLDKGNVLFPNAIILALGPTARFVAARGTKPSELSEGGVAGTLSIPLTTGKKAAWIVDGQQRTLALSESSNRSLSVPVIAFVSTDLGIHREQFVLVNRARPLPARLIDELLPVVGSELPRDLSARRVPSALCHILNTVAESPLKGLIKRPSTDNPHAVISDSALIRSIKKSIQDPRGGLAAHVASGEQADMDEMFCKLIAFWRAVRDAFPDAWGKPAESSRLMHSAGIEAMGLLMDQILSRLNPQDDAYEACKSVLTKIAPGCRWTEGRWETIDREWNDIQCIPRDIKALSRVLLTLDRAALRRVAA